MNLFRLIKIATAVSEVKAHIQECESGRDHMGGIGRANQSKIPTADELKKLLRWLQATEELCEDIDLPNAASQIALILLRNQHPETLSDYSAWVAELKNASDALMSDLFSRKVIRIDTEFTDFAENDLLFGQRVNDGFPSAIPDIKESGNCLAAGNTTAAVFHLMRVAEYGLRALAQDRRIKIPKNKPLDLATWDEIIKQLETAEDAIRSFPRTEAREAQLVFYHGALMEFKRFKNKFRNRIMHTRVSYDKDQAKSAFAHVKDFMTILSSHISETERTPTIWKGTKWIVDGM